MRVKENGFEEIAQRIELPAYNRDVMIFLERKIKVTAPMDEIVLGDKFQVDIRQLSIPDKAVREYRQAIEDEKKGFTSRAIERFRRALSIAPNFAEAALRLGSTFYETNRFNDAEKTLVRALTIAPRDPKIRLLLANVFIKQRKYEQALGQIDAYLNDKPADPDRAAAEATRSQLIRTMQRP